VIAAFPGAGGARHSCFRSRDTRRWWSRSCVVTNRLWGKAVSVLKRYVDEAPQPSSTCFYQMVSPPSMRWWIKHSSIQAQASSFSPEEENTGNTQDTLGLMQR
jgi:hypothetical protein